jgi:hypothetical protein
MTPPPMDSLRKYRSSLYWGLEVSPSSYLEKSVTNKVVDFESRRRQQDAESRVAWKALSEFFDGCAIPSYMKPALMFVGPQTYQRWAKEKKIPRRYIATSGKYVRLYRIMLARRGDNERTSWWFLRESLNHIYMGKTPAESIIEGGEKMLNEVLASCEYRPVK